MKLRRTRQNLGSIFSESLNALITFIYKTKIPKHILELGLKKKIKVCGPLKSAGTIFSDTSAL